MAAGAMLRSKRSYWGQDRRWEGNYLSKPDENSQSDVFNSSVNNLRNVDHFKTVLFSAFIKKTNRFFHSINNFVNLANDMVIREIIQIQQAGGSRLGGDGTQYI